MSSGGVADETGRHAPGPAAAALAELDALRRALHIEPLGPTGDDAVVAWAPGRINLIGEHTDYNDGWVLPAAIDRVVAIAAAPVRQPVVTLFSRHHQRRYSFPLPGAGGVASGLTVTPPAPLWVRYVYGTLSELAAAGVGVPTGFVGAIVGDVPLGGGLSSSAALEVAVATVARALGSGPLEPMEVAKLCQRAEQTSVGVRVGIMDQAASCLGRADNAMLLDCRTLDIRYIPARLGDSRLVVFDTRTPHSLASSEYNVRRAQCEEAVQILNAALSDDGEARPFTALRDVTADDLARYGARLPETLFRRARHVVSENLRTLEAADALAAGELERLGDLLNASHASLRDDYQVSCKELDAAADIAQTTPGVWGARMIGAGFGGSVLALARESAIAALTRRLGAEFPRRVGHAGQLTVCSLGGGPHYAKTPLDIGEWRTL